jgi:hypothetical protein
LSSGVVNTVVGNATTCKNGVQRAPAVGTTVCLGAPSALALSHNGTLLYIGDAGGRFIAAFSPASGMVWLVAGTPRGPAPASPCGDDAPPYVVSIVPDDGLDGALWAVARVSPCPCPALPRRTATNRPPPPPPFPAQPPRRPSTWRASTFTRCSRRAWG